MANQVINLSVKVNSDTGQLEVLGAKFQSTAQKAREAQGSMKGLASEASNLAKSLLPFATAGGIVAFFASAVKGAEEENEALRRLQFGLQTTGASWKDNQGAVMAWANAIQNATRFSDTEAFGALDRLVRITGSLTQAQMGAKLAMDLAVASGKSLSETEGVVVNLLNGNQRALIEVNREFGALTGGAKTAQEALDILRSTVSGAAEKEEGFTKATSQLKNAFGEFQEEVGRGIIPALTVIVGWAKDGISIFNEFGFFIAQAMARAMVSVTALATAIGRVARLDFSGAKQAFTDLGVQLKSIDDQVTEHLKENEAKKTENAKAGNQERLVARQQAEEEERRKQAELFEQMDLEINQRMAALGEQTFQQKKNLLDAEVAARRAKINREITDESAKTKLLSKLELEHFKRAELLVKSESKLKTDAAFKVAADSIQALQILNGMQEGHTKEEARRAKILLALQQALAIANLWRAEAGKGAVGIAIAAAGTAVLVAQFAAQSRAIDQARSAAAAGNTSLESVTPLPGGGSLNEQFGGNGAAAPGVAGGGAVRALAGGGGGGGGGTVIVNVGGVTVNFQADHVELSEINTILRRIGDAVRQGTVDGVRMAVTVVNSGNRNASLAV